MTRDRGSMATGMRDRAHTLGVGVPEGRGIGAAFARDSRDETLTHTGSYPLARFWLSIHSTGGTMRPVPSLAAFLAVASSVLFAAPALAAGHRAASHAVRTATAVAPKKAAPAKGAAAKPEVKGMVSRSGPASRPIKEEKAGPKGGSNAPIAAPTGGAGGGVKGVVENDTTGPVGPRGPTRVDFDDRMIEGQTNKTGAVYLFDRKETAVRSMVQARKSYRDELLKTVYE